MLAKNPDMVSETERAVPGTIRTAPHRVPRPGVMTRPSAETKQTSLWRVFAQAYAAVLYFRYIVLKQRFGADAAFQWVSEAAARHRGGRGVLVRRALLSKSFRVAAADVNIGEGTIFTKMTVSIGSRVEIGARCVLGSVQLGDDVSIGDGVIIPSCRR